MRSRLHAFVSPAILEEYGEVLADAPELLAAVSARSELCFPLTQLRLIRHEPDNRFVECALVAQADCLVTVNTAPGHFDRPAYGAVKVTTPGRFIQLPDVQALLQALP